MQDPHWPISDLLALRDRQPRDASVDNGLNEEQLARRQTQVEALAQLRSELNALPDVPVDDAVWMKQRVTGGRSGWLRFPLATAASVFFATAVGIYLLAGQFSPGGQSPVLAVPTQATFAANSGDGGTGLQLAALMTQSKSLERRMHASNSLLAVADAGDGAQRAAQPIERALLFRLADVDAQIAALYEREEVDAQKRLSLWRQRVGILQNMVAVRAGQTPQIIEDSRSM